MSAADIGGVLDAWRELRGDDAREAVLATVVHVRGSSYRRPGARMLIRPDGWRVGSISGGCLDGDVVRRAWWATEGERAAVRVYDTTSDDDAVWEFGLGCNGVVHVLLERVGWTETRAALEFLESRRADRRPAAMATVVATADARLVRVGERLLLPETGPCSGSLVREPFASWLRRAALGSLHDGTSRLLHLEGCDVFLESLGPSVALVVLGAGFDAVPLVALGKRVGWHVTVADCRPAYARRERFPEADRVMLLPREAPLAGIAIDPHTAVVVMTHDFAQDVALLREILPARPRYLGLLGPASRAERLFAEVGGAACPDVHAPVGLDIGAESPAEIAVAIVAEIRAALAGRAGGELRLRSVPIHPAVEEVGQPIAARNFGRERPACGISAGYD